MSASDVSHHEPNYPIGGLHSHESSAPVNGAENVESRTNNFAVRIFKKIGNFFYQGIHKIIGKAVLPAQFSSFFNAEQLKANKVSFKNFMQGEDVTFRTSDGVTLDGMRFPGSESQKTDRTVILFNGNGVRYEEYSDAENMAFDIKSWQKKGWNVVVFNYRGVGESSGIVKRDGLILDGETVLQHVRDEFKVPEDKILLHGHSLGGGIASEVAAKHTKVNYCNDRSFSSLSQQVKVMFGNGVIGSLASKAIVYFGWELSTRDNWDKINGKKFSIYHGNDKIIPNGAKFHETLDDESVKIKLSNCSLPMGESSFLFDDPNLVDEYLNEGKLIASPFQISILKQFAGSIAHMRKFNEEDEAVYFDQLNTI